MINAVVAGPILVFVPHPALLVSVLVCEMISALILMFFIFVYLIMIKGARSIPLCLMVLVLGMF